MEIAEVIELINQVNDDYKINSNKINGLKGLAYKNSLDYSEISNIPTDIVRDPSYVHTDNNFDSQYKNKLDSLSNYSLPMASATVLGGVKKGSGVDITDGVLTVTDQTLAMTSSTANNASVTQHGFAPQAIAPSAGFINYLGLVAGETVFSNKPLFSSNVPSTQNYGDSASAGTAMTAARLDHKHAIPASTKDKTAVTGILKGDGANVSQAVAGTDYVVDTNYVHTDNNLTGSLLTKLNSLNNYSLPIASVSSLGGIKVGSGLSIDAGGVLSTSGLQGTLSGASGGVAILNSNVIRSLVSGSNINITVAGDNITITNTYSYTHPATHPASIIVQDSSNRFVTDTQISNWNAKQNALGYTAENVSNKGIANGYVPLNASAIIDSIYLPSYVDDVLEYNSLSAFPTTGETGKIYVAKDANITYRWGGSGYVEISASLALGTTSSTAYRGDYGNVAYLHSQSTGNPHGATTAQIAESGNLYYTQARFDSAFSGKSTTNLTEGNNLYFTNARAVAALATGNIVNNLNADMVDGKHTSNLYGDWNANLSTVDWNAKDIRAYGMLKGNNIYSLGSLYLETAPIYFLNKAGNDWLLFATRDTSGSEVRVNLDYVGSFHAYGNAQIDSYIRSIRRGISYIGNWDGANYWGIGNYNANTIQFREVDADGNILSGLANLYLNGNLTVNGTGTNTFAGSIALFGGGKSYLSNSISTVDSYLGSSDTERYNVIGLSSQYGYVNPLLKFITDSSQEFSLLKGTRSDGTSFRDIIRVNVGSETAQSNIIILSGNTQLFVNGTGTNTFAGLISANAGITVADSYAIKSATFSSNDPYSGYYLSFNSQIFSHLYAGEMRVKRFIADQEQALSGSQVIAKSTVKLSEDMRKDGLVSGDRFDITVDSYEGSPSLAVFADGYLVRIRQYSRVGLAFNVTDTWAIVQGNTPTYANDGKQQTWSLMYVSGATSFELGKGSIILAYGNPGDGIIENMANGDPIAKLPYGRIRRYTGLVDGIPQFDTLTQWGDLSNITTNVYGQLKGQGFYSQNLYLEGNANIAGTLTAGDANGVGNTFYAGKIKKNLLTNSNTVSTVNIALNGAIPDIFGQNFNFTSGKTYTISFKAKGSGNCDFWLYNNSWNKSQQQNITLTADYVRYTLTYTATTTELYRYGVWTNGTGNTAINLTITEWQLEEGSYATPYQPTDGVLSTDNGYGMWAINGGFGGTIQNPVVALSDYGLILRNVSTTAKVTAQDGVHIGNFSASNDYSGIIQNNTGLYGYQNGNLLMKIANDSAKFVGFDAVSDEIGNRLTTSNGQDGYLALSGTSSYNTGLTVWDSSVYLSIGLGLYKGSQSGNWDSASKGIAFADLTSGKTLFELSNTQRIISGFSFDYQKLYNGNMRLEASSTFKGLAVKNTINKTEYDILKVGQYTPSIISPTTQIVTDANASSLFYQNVTFRDLNASNYINSFYSGDKTLTMNIRAYNSNKTSIQGSEYGSTTGIYSNGQTIGTVWFKLNLSAYANKYIKRIKIGVRRVDGSSCSVNIGNGSIQQIYGTYTYQKNFSGSAEIDNLNLSTNVDTYLCFQITNTSTEELNDYTLNWCFQLFELEIYDSTQFADISDNKIQFYKSGGNEGIFFDENGFRIKSKDLFIGKWKITEIPDNRLVFSVLQTDGSYLEKYRLDPSIAAKTL